jgi:hypothetical protein
MASIIMQSWLILDYVKDKSFLQSIQTGSGTHPTACSAGTGAFFPELKQVTNLKITNNVLLTYLLTSWSRVLLEKLTGSQLVKKFSAFYGT